MLDFSGSLIRRRARHRTAEQRFPQPEVAVKPSRTFIACRTCRWPPASRLRPFFAIVLLDSRAADPGFDPTGNHRWHAIRPPRMSGVKLYVMFWPVTANFWSNSPGWARRPTAERTFVAGRALCYGQTAVPKAGLPPYNRPKPRVRRVLSAGRPVALAGAWLSVQTSSCSAPADRETPMSLPVPTHRWPRPTRPSIRERRELP